MRRSRLTPLSLGLRRHRERRAGRIVQSKRLSPPLRPLGNGVSSLAMDSCCQTVETMRCLKSSSALC